MRRRVAIACLLPVLWAVAATASVDPLDPAGAPTAVRRAIVRAEAAHRRGEVEAAAVELSEALSRSDDAAHPALLYRLGGYLLELGRPAEALDPLRRASAAAPNSDVVWRDYARAAYELGDYRTAAEAFTEAYRVHPADDGHAHDPPDDRLLYYGALSWLLADEPLPALDILESLVAAAADTVPRTWVQALVSAAATAERPARADAGVTRLLRDHPDTPDAWILAARQAQLRDDLPTAARRLQVADWLSPLPLEEGRRLAELWSAADLPRLAARRYAELWPEDADLARPLAVSWMRAHEPDSARVVLHDAVAAGGDAELWRLLGDLEYGVERWEAARDAYARAAELDPDDGRAWLMQGACSLRLDEKTAARAALTRAAERPDTETEARRLLAHLDAAAD